MTIPISIRYHTRFFTLLRVMTLAGLALAYGADHAYAATLSISASPASVSSGASSALTWSSSGATSCAASGAWSGVKPASGSQSIVAPNGLSTYALSCSGPSGSAGNSVVVGVGTPAPALYVLSVTVSGSGSVTSNPNGITCGASCSAPYPSGAVVTLSAIPAAGSTFSGWSGACSGVTNCVVTLTTARSVTATFNPVASAIVATFDFESSNAGLGEFTLARGNGRRCGNAGRDSNCAYSNLISENSSLPPFPAIPFPRQTGVTFVHFDAKLPENFYIGYGSHGYYLYDSTNRIGSIVIDPESRGRIVSALDWDNYTTVGLRGSGYQRIARSFEGFKPRQRGVWHSYQLMVTPSNRDASVGMLKLWIDGELANFAKIDTIPAIDRFWISNYWHSMEYTSKDLFGNLFEAHTAPFHPAFEVLLDNVIISQEFIERGDNRHQIERVKFADLQSDRFTVHFDTTARSIAKLEWGETAQYGNEAPGNTAGFSHVLALNGLRANTLYYLRLSATSNSGALTTAQYSLRTSASGAYPQFNLPDWTGEIYQAQLNASNQLTYSGAPAFIKSFKDLSLVSWSPQDSDTLIRTDQHMIVRYRKQQYFSAGVHAFKVGAYDGVRIIIDGVTRVDAPNRSQGNDRRRDFELTLTEGVHDLVVEHLIYRFNDWEATYSKYVQFIIAPLDRTPPKVITENIYNTNLELQNRPFYVARCDEDCAWVIDYGLTTAYGQQLYPQDREPVSPRPSGRFPALTQNATYHYRVTLRDNAGNVRVMPNRTFTVADTIPPRQITNLVAARASSSAVRLTFSAPGADSKYGTATSYDLRYSTSPITIANWQLATPVTGLAAPQAAQSSETIVVNGLPGGQQYYFAIKAIDANALVGLMSNIAGEPALPQVLDQDGDGYGVGSALGNDCDDYDAQVYAVGSAMTGTCIAP